MKVKKPKPALLIVDDEPNFSESLQMALEDSFSISLVQTVQGARDYFKENLPEAVLVDLKLPDGEGTELLQDLKDLNPMPVAIIMTAYATVENAVKAVKEGAVDYFTKPLDIEKLKRELNLYLENKQLHKKIIALGREIKKIAPPFTTSGTGKMKEIVDKALMVAPLDIPVLIKGETGTGKEKLANWIHSLSGREGEMVAINCAALPRDILESELFGYTKGAFSGASSYKEGLIEKADGGALFLDEIGELSDQVQAKLLRVLESGVYYKLGSTKEYRARFRLISATNKDLAKAAFREDLYYRINGITFDLPPLRERREDISLLVPEFINEANNTYKKNVAGLTPETMKRIMKYNWPGNIRELKWCINRAVAMSMTDIIDIDEAFLNLESDNSSSEINGTMFPAPLEDAVEQLEKKHIKSALSSTSGNKTEAAKMLGISVRTLHYKLEKYGL